MAGQTLYPYLQKGLYGFADSTGRIVIEPQYEEVSDFGTSFLFSEAPNPLLSSYQIENARLDNMALAYADNLWYLLDKKGNSILGKGVKGKIRLYGPDHAYKTESPYLQITTDSLADGWGIWDSEKQETAGMTYSYYGYTSPSPIKDRRPNRDLNPFRGTCRKYQSIPDCDCKKAQRKDGGVDIISKYLEVLKEDYYKQDPGRWKDLTSSEKITLQHAELKNLCRQAKSYPAKRVPSKPEQKKKRWGSAESFLKEREHFKDSIQTLTGRRYHEVKKILVDIKTHWTCGLDTVKNRLDIINAEGEIVYKAKASVIPESITHNTLAAIGHLFIKSEKGGVLIDKKGKVKFKKNQYKDIRLVNNHMILAFMDADYPFPLHIYDKKLNRLPENEVYDMTRSYLLTKNDKGDFVCKQLIAEFGSERTLSYQETVEGKEFNFIPLKKTRTKPPEKPQDSPPLKFEETENKNPIIEYGMMSGYSFTGPISKIHPTDYFLSRFKNKSRRNRIRQKNYLFYMREEPQGHRLVATQENMIYLDTMVQEFIALKANGEQVLVRLNDQDTTTLTLKSQNRSFFKRKINYSEMYTHRNGSYTELRAADHSVLSRSKVRYGYHDPALNANRLIDDRYILFTSNTEGFILNSKGEKLHNIERTDPSWLATMVSNVDQYSQKDYELIDDTMLKVYDKKPYLIELETMTVFKK